MIPVFVLIKRGDVQHMIDRRLTEVISDFVHVLKVFHPQTDDVHKVFQQTKQLFDVGPQLLKKKDGLIFRETFNMDILCMYDL